MAMVHHLKATIVGTKPPVCGALWSGAGPHWPSCMRCCRRRSGGGVTTCSPSADLRTARTAKKLILATVAAAQRLTSSPGEDTAQGSEGPTGQPA